MVTFAKTNNLQQVTFGRLIGNTPLLRLTRILGRGIASNVELYAKAEWFNPGGSVKDRAAWEMIREGISSGTLTPGKILIDATSGNTGIAYAMLGAALGYRVKLAVPANASIARKRMLAALGAEVISTDPLEGTDGAQDVVRRLVQQNPDMYFYPDQYNNPANWRAHYRTTGLEIFSQTSGRITHFIAGLGTTGTFVGVARRLKEACPRAVCIAVQPDTALHGIEGLKHLPTAVVPRIFDPALVDETVNVGTEEAYEMLQYTARTEGLLIGISGAAALVAARRVAARLETGVIVTVLPDHGSRYLNETFWETIHADAQSHRTA